MQKFLDRLNSIAVNAEKPIVADGGMGSLLFKLGLKPGDCPEELNLSRQDLLQKIGTLYFEAGAEILQTNTFGGSPLKLADYGLAGQTEEINANAVRCVKKVVGEKAYVSGSMGPCGKLLKPYGDIEPDEVRQSFCRQAKALIEAGVDLLCVETMIDLNEAKLAIEGIKAVSNDIPIMATMTFDKIPRGFFTIMGVTVNSACKDLESAGANVIGSNCGNGLDTMILLAKEFSENTTMPIIIQSNAGLPKNVNGEIIYDETPEFFAERVGQLVSCGVSIIGGCCGTTPEHIIAIKKALKTVT